VPFFFFLLSTFKRNQPFSETTHHTDPHTLPFSLSLFSISQARAQSPMPKTKPSLSLPSLSLLASKSK